MIVRSIRKSSLFHFSQKLNCSFSLELLRMRYHANYKENDTER